MAVPSHGSPRNTTSAPAMSRECGWRNIVTMPANDQLPPSFAMSRAYASASKCGLACLGR